MGSERPRRAPARRYALCAAGLAVTGCGQPPAEGTEALGSVDFPASCGADVQPDFDRALALLHHMTYPEAREAFERIVARRPECAMAHWGVAMTLFQPLWPTRPGPADLELGWQRARRARELALAGSREAWFAATAEAFFRPDAADYWARIGAWEAAARAAYDALPGDEEAAAFYALAHLATAPASGGTEHHDSASAILLRILADHPDHPGAVHYLIHANDAPGREHHSLDVVRRYVEIAPSNPHALHMPTHVYVRLGEWQEVIGLNLRAADAALEHPAGERGQWVWDEFPHALEYLVYAHLQRGDDAAARHEMARLLGTPDLEPSFKTAFHVSSIPARFMLERRDWAGAAGLPVRPDTGLDWERFPWPEAVTWFARGLGSLRVEDGEGSARARGRLDSLLAAAERSGEPLFARQTEILRLELAAWTAAASARGAEALELMRSAVAMEAGTPKHAVTPAPTLPASEQLGDLLLELGRPAEALEAYRVSLEATPGRFNGLLGAARSAAAAGDTVAATEYYGRLLEQAAPAAERAAVAEAAGFVDR